MINIYLIIIFNYYFNIRYFAPIVYHILIFNQFDLKLTLKFIFFNFKSFIYIIFQFLYNFKLFIFIIHFIYLYYLAYLT